jgi:hypothetical protein
MNEHWSRVDKYDLQPGELLQLNIKLYKNYSQDARRQVINTINQKHCPKKGRMYECVKLTESRLKKILSGAEYNSFIIRRLQEEVAAIDAEKLKDTQ